jgi:hypothetical protein
MFGNGNGNEQVPATVEPPSSASLWGDMFGIGGLIKTMTDPALGQHIHMMLATVIEAGKATQRVEAKLDAILKAQENAGNTAVFTAFGTDGNRGLAAPGGASNDGSGSATQGNRGACGND